MWALLPVSYLSVPGAVVAEATNAVVGLTLKSMHGEHNHDQTCDATFLDGDKWHVLNQQKRRNKTKMASSEMYWWGPKISGGWGKRDYTPNNNTAPSPSQ